MDYHDHVTVELDRFHRVTGAPMVNPFILVVAQDTKHARRLRAFIESEDFFKGLSCFGRGGDVARHSQGFTKVPLHIPRPALRAPAAT